MSNNYKPMMSNKVKNTYIEYHHGHLSTLYILGTYQQSHSVQTRVNLEKNSAILNVSNTKSGKEE